MRSRQKSPKTAGSRQNSEVVGSWWCWDWFEEKNAAGADNLPKNRTFEEKTALCGQTGNGRVGSRLVCDHAPEYAGISKNIPPAANLKAAIPPLKFIED